MTTAATHPSPAVPLEQRCPEHPERKANGTCARCGRFVCGQCAERGAGLHCSACVRQLMSAVPFTGLLAQWTRRLLYAHVALGAVQVLMALLGIDPDVLSFVELAGVPIYIATVVVFLRWLHRAVRLAGTLDEDMGVTPGWAVGYWFIPIVNLFRPYQAIKRLAAAVYARSTYLGWWWAMWLLSNVMDRAEMRLPEPPLALLVASDVVSILAALLMVGTVMDLERGLVERRAAFQAAEVPMATLVSVPGA